MCFSGQFLSCPLILSGLTVKNGVKEILGIESCLTAGLLQRKRAGIAYHGAPSFWLQQLSIDPFHRVLQNGREIRGLTVPANVAYSSAPDPGAARI
jgi:hypothetical protein